MDSEQRRRGAHRVVEVWAGGRDQVSYGSGYAVSDDLVLTARHVLREGPPYRVRLFGGTDDTEAQLAWEPDGALDAALLRVPSAPWRTAPDRGALRWGRVKDSGVRCWAHGFPRAQQRADGSREPETLQGSISRTTGALGGRYHVDITSASPIPLGAGASAWQGMSGAVLFGPGRELLGVVVDDPVMFGGRRLEAVTVSRLLEDQRFAGLVRAYAHQVEEVHPWPLVSELDAWSSGFMTPAYEDLDPVGVPDYLLLQAKFHRVPFLGREEELGRLRRWWAAPDRFSVAVVTGDGGAGKTRLAAELCQEAVAKGWSAGFASLRELTLAHATRVELVWPTLLVIDYPDGLTDTVGRLLAGFGRPGRRGAPLRLLLLDRTPGQDGGDPRVGFPLPDSVTWWADLRRSTSGLVEHSTRELIRLAAGRLEPADRVRHARKALRAFGGSTVPAVLPDLSDDGYSNPLKVHLAVLLALRGQTSPTASGTLKLFVGRERTRWERRLEAHGIADLDPRTTHQAVVLATLTTPNRAEAVDLLTTVPELADRSDTGRRVRTAEWLRGLFPGPGDRLAPLAPDLLAEQLLEDTGEELTTLALDVHDHPAHTLDHTIRMLEALQLAARQDGRRHVRAALRGLLVARLGGLVDEAAAQPRSQLPTLVETSVEWCAALDTDGALAAAAAAVRHPGPFPDRPVAALRCRVAALAVAGYDAGPRPTPAELRVRADLLTDLVALREALGDLGQATKGAERAYQENKGGTPVARARAAYNLGTCLARSGDLERAVTLLGAAADDYARLAAQAASHRAACADALINLSACHADAGRQGDAARTLVRAIESHGRSERSIFGGMRELLVDLARSLDAAPEGAPVLEPDPGGYRPCVGSDPDWPRQEKGYTSTLERGIARVVEGFGARAPDRIRNALVPLLSRRAAGNQARHQAFNQAEQLRLLAWTLAFQKRYDAALVPAVESVELLRRLVVPAEPSERWMLARGLGILVDYSSAAGRITDAIGHAQELVAERRALLPDDFVAYPPTGATASHRAMGAPAPGSALASALGSLADLLRLADRLPEAVEPCREAFALYAELALHHPEHRRDLGEIAAEFADLQLELDRPNEAVDAVRTEAEVYGELAAEDEQYTGRAAEAFTSLSQLLVFAGGDGPARSLAAAERAVGLLDGRGPVDPDRPLAEVEALVCVSTALFSLGRTAEAADQAEQAVAICRAVGDGGDERRALLGLGLSLAGVCALRLGRPEDGVAAGREAVDILTELPVEGPLLLFMHGMALSTLASGLVLVGNPLEAEGRAAEAAAVFDNFEERGEPHDVFGVSRAETLVTLAQCRIALGRPEEALDPLARASEDLRPYTADNPVVLLALARTRHTHGLCLAGLGQPAEALVELGEVERLLGDADNVNKAMLLAETLAAQGSCHVRLGRFDLATERFEESADVFESLPSEVAAVVQVSWARTLIALAECLVNLGELLPDAIDAAEEGVELLRDRDTPAEVFLRASAHLALARSGHQLGEPFGYHADEAVALLRGLPADDPSVRPTLAKSLGVQAVHRFTTAGQATTEEAALAAYEGTVAVASEAAELYREWPGEPEALVGLGSVLNLVGCSLTALARPVEALGPLREAVDIFRGFVDVHPSITLERVAAQCQTALCHLQLEQPAAALILYEEAGALLEPLAQQDPAVFGPQLLEVLDGQARTLRELGRDTPAEGVETRLGQWRQAIS
ncbi:trypsin-like peptidase domain-containing protein [Streptomyces sp. NBC_00620]|uniref:trypsin-like peptidase domain-containing protein n=1 Tax=Streptomyces sp. NBC_00620 TaxID=2903666 RepID=UPI00224CCA18|nr:trypsin-like peptidase domain-containing protein [Streptomyces sp. NBC_00620]MCX4979514.1 trypsin-like peptidase domain-containing protein [Streptomyces sp. NBC_00620]